MVVNNGLIMQWGVYVESYSYTDWRYWPITFPNSFLGGHALGCDASYYNWGPCGSNYTWDECKEKFLCGISSDTTGGGNMRVIGLGY